MFLEEGATATESHDTGTQANTTENATGQAEQTTTEKDATGDSTKEADPARTEPVLTDPEPVMGGRRRLYVPDLGEFGHYIPTDEDASHGITAGEVCAAHVVKINVNPKPEENVTVNLHVLAPDSATVLFKANVELGEGPGLFRA